MKEICGKKTIHNHLVELGRQALADTATVSDMALLFKAMGDETRIKILVCLRRTEMCVCDLAATLDLTVSAISHQLKHLRQLSLVKCRREGNVVFYSLDDDHVSALLDTGSQHVTEK